MRILGISAFYHDSAAALLEDGQIVAAAQEERFTRKKHDFAFPSHAVRFCLQTANIEAADLDYVVFYEKPLQKFDRLLETWLSYAPRGFGQFVAAIPLWLRQKLRIPREIDRALENKYKGPLVFTEHHESHAASAFFPSPFEDAAILTMDGVGEWTTASCGIGEGNKITLKETIRFPHSLGLLYSAFTYFTGFKVNSGEYKLMGLAPYGEASFAQTIREKLIDIKEDGSFRLNMEYFPYGYRNVMVNEKFEQLFGGPARKPESPITQREMDLAASIQQVTEEVMLKAANHVHETTGKNNLVLAGGVALNCVGNGRILRESPFENIWIQPAAGDAGGALGAAMFVWYQLLENERTVDANDFQKGSLLGPAYSDEQICTFLESTGAVYKTYQNQHDLLQRTAELIAEGKIVGWFQGRMEFGPRALGSRSILGDARNPEMQKKMNLKIKFRESFRPFAPCVLRETAAEHFEIDENRQSPYMLLVTHVRKEKQIHDDTKPLSGLQKLDFLRSDIPAVTHVDYSARLQTVDAKRNPKLHRLLNAFKEKTGTGVLINTSFNIRGEPIVCTPEDAYRCFMATDMDVLVMENCMLLKKEQPNAEKHNIDAYLAKFEPD